MPNNKYLYLSSVNATNAADFQVNLPENLIIQPYSEVRAVSVRVNPDNNAINITNSNNRFYIGVDNWNKYNHAVPPLEVTLNKGVEGLDDFAKSLEEAIEVEFDPFCFCRGGASVSMTDKKLTFKVSQMQMYGIPKLALTDSYFEFYDDDLDEYEVTINNVKEIIQPIEVTKAQMALTNTIYGVDMSYDKDDFDDERALFISPEIVQGLMNYDIEDGGNSKADAPVTAYFEIDTANMDDGDVMFITCGFFDEDDVYNENDSKRPYRVGQQTLAGESSKVRLNMGDLGGGKTGSNNVLFVIQVKKSGVGVIRPKLDIKTGSYQRHRNVLAMTENAKLKIVVTEYEQDKNADKINASYFNIEIDETTNNGGAYTNLFSEQNYKATQYSRNYYQNDVTVRAKRYLVDFSSSNDIEVKASFAVDDDEDEHGFNRQTGAYGGRASLSTNLGRTLTILSNLDQDPAMKNAISKQAIDDLTLSTGFETGEKLIDSQYWQWNNRIPNMEDELGNDDVSGMEHDASSFTQGVAMPDEIDAQEQQFPQYYLDIPTLPLGNISANYLQGRKNTFVCPIDLQASENNINLYTSQLYTMNYNQLTNSYPLNINTMKIRICNIDGSVAQGIDKDTIICLEIRDNPDIKNNQMIIALRNIEKNYSPGSAPGNFIKDQ